MTLQFPTEVPDELIHHFIRGCFDGDGHVSKKKECFNVNFTSSKDFMSKFIDLLDNLKVEHTGAKKRYKDKEHSAYSVYIRSNSATSFFKYIYNNSTLFLERKQKITI